MSADDKRALIERIRQNVPAMLRELPVWVLHDAAKVPIYVKSGKNRSGTMDRPRDRKQMVSFEDAALGLLKCARAVGLGVALGLVPNTNIQLCGIDLDHCLTNGVLDERVAEVVSVAQSYAERSFSGTGVHIIGTGNIGTVKKGDAGLEIYSGKRFFTVTGDALNGAALADLADAAALARRLNGTAATHGADVERPADTAASGTYDNPIVAAIKRAGLHIRNAGDGKHLMRCPWEPLHSLDKDGNRNWSATEAVYFAPGAVVGDPPTQLDVGLFKCEHTHCARRRLRDLVNYLGIAPLPDPDDKPAAAASDEWVPPDIVSYSADFDPAKIPRRRWRVGRRRSVGEMTVDVGPAATNKSMLMLTDAVAIVTGRSILDDIAHEQGEVLLFAGEDARRDVEARLAGILQHHEIEPAELAGRLHVVYLAEIDPLKYSLAQMRDDMATLNGQMLDWLRDRPGILAILLDPIAAWHRLIENDNVAMQLLCTTLRAVAVQGRRHVGFNHHVNKAAMTDVEAHVGNLAALRGATAIVNSVRWTFTLARLSEKTAEEYGIAEDERRHYRRLDSGKASYGPDDDDTRLLRVVSVSIANGEEIGVLVEVDTTQARKRGEERETTEGQKQRERLAAALTRMLREKRPRSTRATGRWLVVYEPQMFVGASGKCLSEESIRRKLLAMIGDGLPVPHEPTQRIVVRLAEKRGESDEVDFKQADLPLAEVEQPRNRDTMKSG